MRLSQNIQKMWETRDELSPRNFRAGIFSVFLLLPLMIIIGDLRFIDQELFVFGVDSNNLIMMIFGLGFLPVIFIKEKHMLPLLRLSAVAQAVLFILQLFVAPGMPSFIVYLMFHLISGVGTACGFYLFAFALNNVERLFTMVVAQLYYASSYLFLRHEPFASFFSTYGSAAVILMLVVVSFMIKKAPQTEESPAHELGARDSGISTIIVLSMIYYVITLMAMYIEYRETTMSAALYGIGGFAAVAVIFVVMLVFNYSALHLWSLCLVCSVLGIGALHYAMPIAVNGGSLIYGLGEGLGFMIIYYLQGGALKRSGSFRLFGLCCLFTCINYVVISGAFDKFYRALNAPNLALAFPAVLVLAMVCFLFSPILTKRLFLTNWTDGYHMADMPLYAKALKQVERIDEDNSLGLTPREMEIFTLLLTDAAPKQIAAILHVSYATVNFHSKNLYRKLNIQSRTELFAQYGNRQEVSV